MDVTGVSLVSSISPSHSHSESPEYPGIVFFYN